MAPEGDLGLVDDEAGGRGRDQARRRAHGAVDVDHAAARAAHEVVVVVANPPLEQGRLAGGLDPTGQPGGDEHLQDVVDRLQRHGSEPVAHPCGDLRGRQVLVVTGRLVQQLQHGGPRRRDAQAARSQPFGHRRRHMPYPTIFSGMSQDQVVWPGRVALPSTS